MPFFVTRRIIEGLGLGLACRAARKLVPVVLTLGSGPSGFPRKLSRRRLKLPRQPGRGASLALASVILALGAVGLPEKTFRATAEASATAMANPRRRSRALRYSGAGGWPAGLPETIFRVTAKASATASLALASVVLALGGGRTGFPKQVSKRCKRRDLGRPVAAKAVLSTRSGQMAQISKFGLRVADFILSRIRSLSAVKPSHFYQDLPELQLSQGRPAAVAVLSSLGGARRSRSLP